MRKSEFSAAVCWLGALLLCAYGAVPGRGGVYVVDRASPGAADSNPGTEGAPFKTIQHAADLATPGDTVFVMAGRYEERVHLNRSGAAGKMIAFQSMPKGSAAANGFELQADYVRVSGFEITAEKPAVAFQLNGSHCELLDNYIHHMSVAVAGTVGKPGPGGARDYSAVAHNRIAYNKVYHSQYGFVLGGDDWLVENNEVERLFMYSPGNKYDDCDYTRFFGNGCVQRYNYYHGSIASEIGVAHVDCLQTFTVNGEISQNLLFENNACFDFHQMCMVESAPHLGSVSNWILRGNIVSANAPTMSGGWGPDIIQTEDVTIENNTISGVRWATIGLRGKESTNGKIRDNILAHAERAVIHGDSDFSAANPTIEHNLTFATSPLPGGGNINGKDPLFVDPDHRNFRLQTGSPAIGAGQGGATLGALPFPNVYYVDPKHPAATDAPGWAYPAVPLKTLSKACALARPGETVILRGGVYRETLRPQSDGVTFRALPGERVTISRADVIGNWQRENNGTWSAPLASRPRQLFVDGKRSTAYTYERSSRRVFVKTDPRLHLFETSVRKSAVELKGKKQVFLQGISAEE